MPCMYRGGDMTDILHKRIYKMVEDMDVSVFDDLSAEYGVDNERDLFRKIAEEIEKEYIPLPRYDDGEPVRWDARGIDWNETAFGKDKDIEWCFNAIDRYGRPLAYASLNQEIRAVAKMEGGRVVRSKPKMFDADGAEIKAGDVVWTVDNPNAEWKVDSIVDGHINLKRRTGSYCNHILPELLTHKRPVLDVDGELIKLGDRVWRVEGDWYGHVIGFDVDEEGDTVVLCDSMKSYANHLTHKRPVLDADGVPIKVGDTVWRTDPPITTAKVISVKHYQQGHPAIVCIEKEGKVTAHYSPSLLTHKEPVLDAGGVPIKIGDTVWSTDHMTLESAKVTDVRNGFIDLLWSDGERGVSINPVHITHKEPDSLESLKLDALSMAAADDSRAERWMEFADRISAIIERSA